MYKIRIKFIRGWQVMYISHLDLMRTFERAFRRADIPAAFSEGFNPRPKMVFGLPLATGVTSEAEYADFLLDEKIDLDVFVEKLNMVLPQSMKVIGAIDASGLKDNIMATVGAAFYRTVFQFNDSKELMLFKNSIIDILKQEEIIAEKYSKNGPKFVNIRPMVLEYTFCGNEYIDVSNGNNTDKTEENMKENIKDDIKGRMKNNMDENMGENNILCVSFLLKAGSQFNLKPELLADTLAEKAGISLKSRRIHRTGLLVNRCGELMEPFEACKGGEFI